MGWTSDNWWVGPDAAAIERHALKEGTDKVAAARDLLERRERWIAAVAADPYRLGYEPSIWWVAWALVGFPWCQESTRRYLAGRLGVPEEQAWEEWGARLRRRLGLPEPVVDLLVMGANRCAKSEWGAKSTQRLAANTPNETALFLAQQFALSAMTVQPRLWRYMPAEWRQKHMGDDWYVHYKDLKGFSEAQYQLPSRTKVIGKFYSQDPKEALVGCEAVWAWSDELIPPQWHDELGRRLASRKGKQVLTFTPIEGYTAVVKGFLDGARTVKTATGYLLPRDGGPQLPWLAVGLTRDEWLRREQEVKAGRVPTVPASRAEDCVRWLEEGQEEEPEEARGRDFERVPRVALCFDGRRAVIWFHTRDNPYGEPSELIAREADKGADRVRTILYGIPVKSRSSVLAKYNELVHVVPDAQVPAEGVNYCFADPAGARNDALIWIRSTPTADYVYREWPGSYTIPGVGVPGPWAKPSGRAKGWNDGDRDEGSESFGFGFCRMKLEVARLEGWRDWDAWAKGRDARDVAEGIGLPDEEELEEWDEARGARERIAERFMDSRAAGRASMENAGEITLLGQWNRLNGWDWGTTPGNPINLQMVGPGGLSMIASALDYEAARDGSLARPPCLYIAESCRNVRFALATYTGGDGTKGAVKDWVDMIRYFYELNLARCAGADPLEVARIWGKDARGAAQAVTVMRMAAGGGVRTGVEIRRAGNGERGTPNAERLTPNGIEAGAARVRAGGIVTGAGARGARMVWRGRR